MNKRGQILIIVFGAIGLVSLAVGTLALRSDHELRLSRIPVGSLQCKAISQAAVYHAMAILENDEDPVDHLGEAWATGLDGETQTQLLSEVAVGPGVFSVGVTDDEGKFLVGFVDEGRKMHLNSASSEVLAELVSLVDKEGEVNPTKIAEAIVDWRDEAEGSVCEGRTPACHNAPFESVDELRLVPGVTLDLFTALQPYVTVYGSGSVNINTAPAVILNALSCAGENLVAQREVGNPPVLDPDSSCLGTVSGSNAFTVSVEASLPQTTIKSRLSAVIDREGRILAWSPR